MAATAAVVLADSGREADAHAAEETLRRLIDDTRDAAAGARQEAAAALSQITEPTFPGAAGAALERRRMSTSRARRFAARERWDRSIRCSCRRSSRCWATAILKPAARDDARQLRRRGARRARLFSEGFRGARLGAPPHSSDARAASRRSGRWTCWLTRSPIRTGFSATRSWPPSRSCGAITPISRSSARPIEALVLKETARYYGVPDAAVQPRTARRRRPAIAARARARGQARRGRSIVSTACSA